MKNTLPTPRIKILILCLLAVSCKLHSAPDDMSPQKADLDLAGLAQLLAQEKHEQAMAKYLQALEVNPNNFEAHFHLGNELYNQKKFDEAIKHYRAALDVNYESPSTHFNLGMALLAQKKIKAAAMHFKNAFDIKPDYTKAYLFRGIALQRLEKYDHALICFKIVVEREPNNIQALTRLASTFRSLDQLDDAFSCFMQAARLKPNDAGIYLELGNTLNTQDKTTKALEMYEHALSLNPKNIQAQYNRSYTLKKLSRIKEAIREYKKLLLLKPDHAAGHFGLALSYLLLGDFKKGWKEYEWRWAKDKEIPRPYKQPMWDGSDLHGKTLLLYAEQGLGDTFQFIRLAQQAKERGARVILETQTPLTQLIHLCPYLDEVYPRRTKLPHFDVQAPLMSLPLILKLAVDSVPSDVPYLHADPTLVEHWRDVLAEDKNFKIGICWQGNPNYHTFFLRKTVAAKSMPLHHFAQLAALPSISLYSLQKMSGEDQLKDITFEVNTFGEDFDTAHGRFMDTAAVMKNLDLVITVDTSISHLAGGLGVPTWLLLPNPPDWRWMLDCDTTPWYPQMQLFRQPEPGDWQTVMQQVTTQVHNVLAGKASLIESQKPQVTRSRLTDADTDGNNAFLSSFDDIKHHAQALLNAIAVLEHQLEQAAGNDA